MIKNEYDGLPNHFQLIESQVQFGDSKASMLVAGNAILLALDGGLVKMLSGCQNTIFDIHCITPSLSLYSVASAGFLLITSVVISLFATRPASIHNNPPKRLYLLSHIAKLDEADFIKQYTESSSEDLYREALSSIHGKAVYATKKFKLLRWSIDCTIASMGLIVFAMALEIGQRFV